MRANVPVDSTAMRVVEVMGAQKIESPHGVDLVYRTVSKQF